MLLFLYIFAINKIFYVSAEADGFLFVYFERAKARPYGIYYHSAY
ncbi:hypothetical protein EMIT036CA2_60225 [Chryseobacterium sp. IT-36CA2]